MSCETAEIAAHFVKTCGHSPKQGILEKYYFNLADVDVAGSTLSADGTMITDLVLLATKKIYSALGTDINTAKQTLVDKGFGIKAYQHTDEMSILYRGSANRAMIQTLVDGARVGTIVKRVDTGVAGENAYEVYGWESGMLITNDDVDTSSDSGVTKVVLATKEGEEESTGAKLFFDTDVATTAAWIVANLAA